MIAQNDEGSNIQLLKIYGFHQTEHMLITLLLQEIIDNSRLPNSFKIEKI